MEYTETIYKKDSKGKLRQLTVSASDGVLSQESGLIDGKKILHTSLCKPKNVGKSNETTSITQAIAQAQAKVKAKLDEGYFTTQEQALDEKVILPMLAHPYEKHFQKIDWSNAFVQPKLDGMRSLRLKNGLISRKNKPINTLPHIISTTIDLPQILDGELYAHGLSFQENMKLIKKHREESVNVKYHVYDLVMPDAPFTERYSRLVDLTRDIENVEIVPTHIVRSLEDVKDFHAEFLSQGYEGTMIRWGDEGYKVNGRSSNLLKFKDFLDITATVVDVVPSDKSPEQGVVHCVFNGNTFGCGMKFSHADREEILNNKEDYIGQTAEIRFFEYSDDGIPRFPVCVGFRLDK